MNNLHYDINSLAQRLAYSAYDLDLSSTQYPKNDIKISAIKTKNAEKSNFENNVYFREGLKNELVSLGLSNENLQKLEKSFGSTSIEKDSEGNIILKDKAEKFVSAWFNDIAYKRGYAMADINNDGSLSLKEKYNTNAFFGSGAVQTGNHITASNYINYAKATDFINANDSTGVNSVVSNSIEEELNRTLKEDEDMDGKIYIKDMHSSKDIIDYFKKIMSSSNNEGLSIPSFGDIFGFLEQLMKDTKEMLKKQLKKHLKQAMKAIDSNTSTKELFENIMKQENGIESLNKIKEQNVNLNSTTRRENEVTFFDNKEDEAIFNEIAKLTKLDKDTLAYNLANNENFEEHIISIVQELTQSVDKAYALNSLNLSHSSQKILDIKA